MTKILIIDDDVNLLYSLRRVLEKKFQVSTAENSKQALEILKQESFNLIFLDLKLGNEDGIDLLKKIKSIRLDIPVIMLTAYGTNDSVILSMSLGAEDFLTKPVSPSKLFEYADKYSSLSSQCGEGDFIVEAVSYSDDSFIGISKEVRLLLKTVGIVSFQDYPVFVTGETGTGKDLIARLIHSYSTRGNKPFVAINCAAIPENLLESELFGYTKGAFTGAFQAKAGKFEIATGGTIFLDEIGDMPVALQAKLLRVLQEGAFEPLGGNHTVKTDVRVIAATNQNIKEKIKQGEFRADLFFRLNVIDINIPPLRERKEDIMPLALYFASIYGTKLGKTVKCISARARDILEDYLWYGNVRELQNAVKKAVSMFSGGCLRDEDFAFLKETAPKHNNIELFATGFNSMQEAIESIEKYFIQETITKNGGHLGDAAKSLGISRVTLNEKRKKYGLLSDIE